MIPPDESDLSDLVFCARTSPASPGSDFFRDSLEERRGIRREVELTVDVENGNVGILDDMCRSL